MNIKELKEISRRWMLNKNNILRIYGCYVNGEGEIITRIDESINNLTDGELDKYLHLFKKTLSGKLGKELLDISFTTTQVMSDDSYALLKKMLQSKLNDEDARNTFYNKVIDSVEIEGNYLILLATETYDVPEKLADGSVGDSESSFEYMLCSICPVKNKKSELGYKPSEQSFRNEDITQIVGKPAVGFMFPCFDDRHTNLYNALFYNKDKQNEQSDLIDRLFGTKVPVSPLLQQEALQAAINETCEEDEVFAFTKNLCSQLSDKIDIHTESKDPEELTLSKDEMKDILTDCGMNDEKASEFVQRYTEDTEETVFKPNVLINRNQIKAETPHVTINIDPGYSYLVEEKVIDGRKCLVIDASTPFQIKF